MAEVKAGPKAVVGVTGLSIWGGVVGEEYLASLKGRNKNRVYLEMQNDAVIACLLDSIMMPLVAAEFETIPAGESEKDKLNADFLWQCMNDMTKYSWRQHVEDKMSMLAWGWSVEEMVFKKRLGPTGTPPSEYADGKIGIHILDPRGQETLDHWKMDDQFNVEQMVQRDPNRGTIIPIDAWKLLHATFRSKKRSPEGTSPLRSLYREWYTRKNLEIIEAIGAERDLCGLPVIYLPYGSGTTEKEQAEILIRNIRQDEEAGLVIPAPLSPDSKHGENGWKFELIASPGSKQFNVRDIIRDLNKIILMRFFAQFLLLGMDKVGTQALVEGSQDFFSLCLKSVQQELLETWNQQLVRTLFNLNPGMIAGSSGLPKIEWADPGSKDTQKVVNMVQAMVSAQVLTPEEKLEDYLRAMTGLPDRPVGVGEDPRGAQPPPLPGAPPLNELLAYEWYQTPEGWQIRQKSATKVTVSVDGKVVADRALAQPDPGDVHIPTTQQKKRRDQCMMCEKPPAVEIIWAEGYGRAWFCDQHYQDWKDESEMHQANEERKVKAGTVPERWSAEQLEVSDVASYAEVAGIKGRPADTKAARVTNEYQGLLTHIYDRWAKKAQPAITSASEKDRKAAELEVDRQLLQLSHQLKAAGAKHIAEAVKMGLKGPLTKAAAMALATQVGSNDAFVDTSLIPRVREKIVSHFDDLEKQQQYQLDPIGLMGLLQSLRAEPAGYAGAFWNGIWIGAGITRHDDDQARQQSGYLPRKVRWVLDPAAKHCKDSEFHRGCPELEGEYDSWDDLPTVPAGDVTCLGNCRCHLEVQADDGSWERPV